MFILSLNKREEEMKIKKINLKSERLILRPFNLKDAEQYTQLGGGIGDATKGVTNIKKAKAFIKNSWGKDSYYLGIFLKETNELIGEFELCHMSWWGDTAGEIGYFIKKENRGKGYATESCKLIINYGFDKLKFRKIYADTDADNLISQKLLKKLGFKVEGVIREKNLVHGKWMNEIDFGLLKSEWKR